MYHVASVIPSSALGYKKEKAQESVSVTVLLVEASRIALSKLDGNCRSPRVYMQSLHWAAFLSEGNNPKHDNYIPRASTVAQSLTLI